MSYCLRTAYPAPDKNSPNTNFCMSCGAKMLLKDRYHALKLLGQGGFGKTFKAVDEDQPRKPLCVIKQFAFSNNDPETRKIALRLFYEEAQHLEALGKHDQIPELLAYFDVEGQPYLVQQFIDGQDLAQELATAGTFNQAKIRELLESLLPVLDFLHHQSPPVLQLLRHILTTKTRQFSDTIERVRAPLDDRNSSIHPSNARSQLLAWY